MKKKRGLRLNTKILIAYLCIAATISFSSVSTYFFLSKINSVDSTIYKNQTVYTKRLLLASSQFEALNAETTSLFLLSKKEDVKQKVDSVTALQEEANSNIAMFEEVVRYLQIDKQDIEFFIVFWNGYKTNISNILSILQTDGEIDKVLSGDHLKGKYQSELKPKIDFLTTKLKNWTEKLQELDRENIKKGNSAQKTASNMNIFIGLAVFAVSLLIAYLISAYVVRYLTKIIAEIDKMTEGSLREREMTDAKDELGRTQNSFYAMNNAVKNIIEKIRREIQNIRKASDVLSEETFEFEHRTRERADSLGNVLENARRHFAEFENQTETIGSTAGGVERLKADLDEMKSVNQFAYGEAVKSMNTMKKLNGQMAELHQKVEASDRIAESLEKKSEQINRISEMIEQISRKIKLLSINAQIRTDQSGDEARSFTPISTEILNLGGQTSKITQKISTAITQMQEGIKDYKNFLQNSKDDSADALSLARDVSIVYDNMGAQMSNTDKTFDFFAEKVRTASHFSEAVRVQTEDLRENYKEIVERVRGLREVSEDEAEEMKTLFSLSFELEDVAKNLEAEISKIKS